MAGDWRNIPPVYSILQPQSCRRKRIEPDARVDGLQCGGGKDSCGGRRATEAGEEEFVVPQVNRRAARCARAGLRAVGSDADDGDYDTEPRSLEDELLFFRAG